MRTKATIRHALKDRFLVISWICFFLISLITEVVFAFQIHPSDLNVQVRYTAFGFTNYYDDAWYYLLTFIGFGLFVLIVHSFIAAKLHEERGPYFARLFLIFSIVIVIIAYFILSSVLEVSSLR